MNAGLLWSGGLTDNTLLQMLVPASPGEHVISACSSFSPITQGEEPRSNLAAKCLAITLWKVSALAWDTRLQRLFILKPGQNEADCISRPMIQTERTLPAPKRLTPTSQALKERDERLESMLLLASRLAHDFNNYLAPIVGYLSLIKEETSASSAIAQYAAAMEGSARKAESVITQILTAARPNRQWQGQEVNLAELLGSEVAAWQASLPPNAGIDVRQTIQPCTLYLDEAQWRSAIGHALANARFALATGGTLTVSLLPRALAKERAAELGIATIDVFELAFQDNGFGMPKDTVHRAFDPFYTTRPKTQGFGLGLTTIHAIARFHGGQVALESQENVGTTLKIWLPAGPPEASSESTLSTPATSVRLDPAAVPSRVALLIHEDPLVVEVIRQGLQRSGFELLSSGNAAQGLKLLKRQSDEIVAAIVDAGAQEMDGIGLAKAMRTLNPTLPIIFLCGAEETGLEEALAGILPPTPITVKRPFRLKGLVETVERLTC